MVFDAAAEGRKLLQRDAEWAQAATDGMMAYMRSMHEITVPGTNGTLITLHMRGVSIWRRDPDGVWRCVVNIANEEPAT